MRPRFAVALLIAYCLQAVVMSLQTQTTATTEQFFLLVLLPLALASFVGYLIGRTRNNGPLGALLGLMGPIGWGVILLLKTKRKG